ncbi:MAG: maturation protein [Sanya atkins-like virus 2]|nr:MAG: maturation protein [Sanya atkins-like virus 2]
MPRNYTKSQPTSYLPKWSNEESRDGSSFRVYSRNTSRATLSKVVNGQTLANYKSLIATGNNATTTLDAFERSISIDHCPYNYIYNTTNKVLYRGNINGFSIGNTTADGGNLATSVVVADAVKNAAIAQARSALVKYVRNKQTPFASQVFLGESKEILNLLRDPLAQSKKLIESYGKYADSYEITNPRYKGKGRRNKKLASDLASSWLEFRFAILPLISDINSIIEIYNQNIEKVERLRFYGVADTPSTISSNLTYNNGLWTNYYRVERKNKAECFIRAGLSFERLAAHEGLKDYLIDSLTDISNVVPTAYELTPYSFLLDYFVNIGDIISAATIDKIGLNYTSESVVLTGEVTQRSNRLLPIGSNYQFTKPIDLPYITFRYRSVKRSTLQSLIPPMTFEMPSTGIKYANLAALITLQLTKLRS